MSETDETGQEGDRRNNMQPIHFSDLLQRLKNDGGQRKAKTKATVIDYKSAMTLPVPDHCCCSGRGMIKVESTRGDYYAFCICRRQEFRGEWALACLKTCGLDWYTLDHFTFDRWVDVLNPGCREAKRTLLNYAEGKPSPPWIFLRGVSGLGKTHLAIATVGRLIANGHQTVYYRAKDLETELRDAIETNSVSQVSRRLGQIPVLVLDDLGTQHETTFIEKEFHAILDQRYIQGMRTVITTNDRLADFPTRLRSRLTDTLRVWLLEMEGQDARPRLMEYERHGNS